MYTLVYNKSFRFQYKLTQSFFPETAIFFRTESLVDDEVLLLISQWQELKKNSQNLFVKNEDFLPFFSSLTITYYSVQNCEEQKQQCNVKTL